MRLITTFLFLVFSILNSAAQVCTNGQYILDDNGETEAQSIVHTADGGFIIAGITAVSGAGLEDIFVTKFDNENNVEWSKNIFNRWGENVHSELAPWDGSYNGIKQPAEIYVYFVSFECNGATKNLMGNVTLLR